MDGARNLGQDGTYVSFVMSPQAQSLYLQPSHVAQWMPEAASRPHTTFNCWAQVEIQGLCWGSVFPVVLSAVEPCGLRSVQLPAAVHADVVGLVCKGWRQRDDYALILEVEDPRPALQACRQRHATLQGLHARLLEADVLTPEDRRGLPILAATMLNLDRVVGGVERLPVRAFTELSLQLDDLVELVQDALQARSVAFFCSVHSLQVESEGLLLAAAPHLP